MYQMIGGPALTNVDTTPQYGVGSHATGPGGKIYKYVQYVAGAGAVAAVAGNFCYYYAPAGVSAGAITAVTSDVSDSAKVTAGVLQAVIPAASYGWVQIKGPATVNQAVPGTDGGALAAGTVDGALIASTAYIDHVAAIAIDASAKIVLLDCPF